MSAENDAHIQPVDAAPLAGRPFGKTLTVFDLTLFTVSAIVLLDTLAATASIGPSAVTWWLLLAVFFALPMGLITAEMGTTYPEQGGLYAWIRNAFGTKWAARAAWGYFINNALWVPSVYVMFSGFLVRLFGLDLPLSTQVGINIALLWVTVAVNCASLEFGKWVPNLGALLKMIIFLTIIVGGFTYAGVHGFANEFPREAMTPTWSDSLKYLPAIIYGMLGFELVSASGEEIKNAERDLPASILLSGVIVIGLYTLSTAAVLAVLPAGDINLVEGLVDMLQMLFGDSMAGKAAVIVFGVAALYTFFSNGVTWSIGCNRASAAAADEGQLPRFFGWKDKRHGAPIGSAIAMGAIGTVVLILYGSAASSNEDLFWGLFAFSAVIFLAPYAALALAFFRMRLIDPKRRRPFRVPGGVVGAFLLTALCVSALSGAIFLFLYVPGEGVQQMTLIGLLVAIAVGEILIALARAGKKRRA